MAGKDWVVKADRAEALFVPGTRWLKAVSSGTRTVIELQGDGVLTEWPVGAPEESWEGTWKCDVVREQFRSMLPGLRYSIGGYVGVVSEQESGKILGRERDWVVTLERLG